MEVLYAEMTTALELIKLLFNEDFFSKWRGVREIREELSNRGFNLSEQLILISLNEAVKKDTLSRLKENNRVKYAQRVPPQVKIKDKELTELNSVLSILTQKKLGSRFHHDIRELSSALKYDCGNSAAFLLRKVLEKAIFYVFASHNKSDLLKEGDNKLKGLTEMINLCGSEKMSGIPVLLPKMVKELSGIKFLGDSAIHDYLMDIELSDMNHQLPIWSVAIKELCSKLDEKQ